MTVRISKAADKMILAQMAGSNMSGANKDTLLQNVKTFLDANYSMFKSQNGEYTGPHIRSALSQVLARGK